MLEPIVEIMYVAVACCSVRLWTILKLINIIKKIKANTPKGLNAKIKVTAQRRQRKI
jgi:hypothetical protein